LLAVPEIKEAIALSEHAAYTPAQLDTYNTFWDTVSSEKTLLADRFREGKAEGLVEGEEKGRVQGRAEGLVEGEEKGRFQGRAEGLAEGERKGKVQLAKDMLAKNFAITLISELTGLTEIEIQNLG